MYFVNQSLKKLASASRFGMILPDVVLYQKDNEKLRRLLLTRFCLENALNMGDVFENVTRPAAILVGSLAVHNEVMTVADFTDLKKADKPAAMKDESRFSETKKTVFLDLPKAMIVTRDLDLYTIWRKVLEVPHRQLHRLVDTDGIQRGVSPDLKAAFLVDSETARRFGLEKEKLRPVLTGGRHVKRYQIERPDLLLIYTSRADDFQTLPRICAYIDQFKSEITCKEVERGKHPLYALHRPRDERLFQKNNKLLGVITEDEIVIAVDDQRTFATDGLYLFGVSESVDCEYVAGILNSRLFVFIYRLLAMERGRVLAQVKPTLLGNLPIRSIDTTIEGDVARHHGIVELVQRMILLHRQKASIVTPHEQTALQRQIDATDREIDQLVYELYGLTNEEIRIVEEATTR